MKRNQEENQLTGAGGHKEPRIWLPYLETVIAFGIIALINWLWFSSDWGFLDIKPHPFWILVVAIPVMYGLYPGMFSGGVAFGLHTLFQATQASAHVDPTVPILMLTCAILTGEVRQRSRTHVRESMERSRSLETEMKDLSTRFTQSESARGLLQHRILSQTTTFASLYEVAKRLDTLVEAEIHSAVAEVTAKLLDAELVSVCSYQNGELEILATYPQNIASGISNECLTTSAVLRECLEKGETVSLRDVIPNLASDQLVHTPLAIAAPLLGRGGEVSGFILVEKISFSQFTRSSVTTTACIAKWSSQSLQTAQLFRETRESDIVDAMTGVYKSWYMSRRLGQEMARASKYAFPLSVAVLEIVRSKDISNEMMPQVLGRVGEVCRRELGSLDLLGRYNDGVSLMIIFPHRDRSEAATIVSALEQKVEAIGITPFGDKEPLTLICRVAGPESLSFEDENGDPAQVQIGEVFVDARL